MEDELSVQNRIKAVKKSNQRENSDQEIDEEALSFKLVLANDLKINVLHYKTKLMTLREKYNDFFGAELASINTKTNDAIKPSNIAESAKKAAIIKILILSEEKKKFLDNLINNITFDETPLKIPDEQQIINSNKFDSLSLDELLDECRKIRENNIHAVSVMNTRIQMMHQFRANKVTTILQDQSSMLMIGTEDEAQTAAITAADFWEKLTKACQQNIEILTNRIKAISPSYQQQIPPPIYTPMPQINKSTPLISTTYKHRSYNSDYDPSQRTDENGKDEEFQHSYTKILKIIPVNNSNVVAKKTSQGEVDEKIPTLNSQESKKDTELESLINSLRCNVRVENSDTEDEQEEEKLATSKVTSPSDFKR